MSEKKEIYRLIHSVGLSAKYKGYFCLADAIELCLTMRMQEEQMKITKDLYPTLARMQHTNPMNIEHNIRRMVRISCSEENVKKLEKIAGRKILYPPTNMEFIDIFTFYLYYHREKM